MKIPSPKSWLGVALALGSLLCPAVLRAATPADAAFEKLAGECIEDLLRSRPETATQLGDHRFDGELSDYRGRRTRLRERRHPDLRDQLGCRRGDRGGGDGGEEAHRRRYSPDPD